VVKFSFNLLNVRLRVLDILINTKVRDEVVVQVLLAFNELTFTAGQVRLHTDRTVTLSDRIQLHICVVGVRLVVSGFGNFPYTVFILNGNPLSVNFLLSSDGFVSLLDVLLETEVGNEVVFGVLLLGWLHPVPLVFEVSLGPVETIVGMVEVCVSSEVGDEVVHGVGLSALLGSIAASSRGANGVRLGIGFELN